MTKQEDYYIEQVKKSINIPLKTIDVFGSSFVFQSPVVVILEVQKLFSKYKYIIKGTNGEEFFRVKNSLKLTLSDMNNKPLLNIRNGFSKICIYEGESHEGEPVVTIKHKESRVARKFTVTYINRLTKQEETLDMNCDHYYRSAGFFMGKEKEGAPMVCKLVQITRPTFGGENIKFTIEIAPGIDNILMIALSSLIVAKKGALKHQH